MHQRAVLLSLLRPPLQARAPTLLRSFAYVTSPGQPSQRGAPRARAGLLLVGGLATVWAVTFGWLAVQRYRAGGSSAEDLGFTDQVLGNFLRGQWFRMSVYQGATWNTEIDISRLARPDSLLAFHFEPMLLLLVPLYALGGGATLLLIVQAVAVAAGAVPAYRLGSHAARSATGGLAVAVAYLLSPFGQWAVLSDFHTSTLAAPLLVLAVERLVVGGSARQSLIVAALAASAREDVGPLLAALGLVLLLRRRRGAWRTAGFGLLGLGLGSTIVAAAIIRLYSGGMVPFGARYGQALGAGFDGWVALLERPVVLEYARTLLLSGGWLGLLSPLALAPTLPSLALNVLSSSPWMAAGKAHYSILVLPCMALAVAAGLRRIETQPRLRGLACSVLLVTSLSGYLLEGGGPFGGNYAPASVTQHARASALLADTLPPKAAVSATSSLVPRVSRRPRVYVFPAVLDAEYVFLDLQASPAPTSAGDVYLHVRSLLAEGGWDIESATDGLLLLHRAPEAAPLDVADLFSVFPRTVNSESNASAANYFDDRVSLLSANLMPSPTGAVDVDGPHWILRTVWRARQPLPAGTHLEFRLQLRDGLQVEAGEAASLWWNPPERWTLGQAETVDIPDVPVREFVSWQAVYSS